MSPSLERDKGLLSEAGWLVLAQAVSLIATFVGIKLLASALTVAQYGLLGLLLSLLLLSNQTIFAGFSSAITRFVSGPKTTALDRGALIGIGKGWSICSVLATLLIVVVWAGMHAASGWQDWGLMALVIAQCALAGWSAALISILNSRRKRRRVAQYVCVEAVLRIGGLWCLLDLIESVLHGVLLVYCLSILAVSVPVTLWLWKVSSVQLEGVPEVNRNVPHQLLSFSLPLSLAGFVAFLQLSLDRWLIGAELGLSKVGEFVALWQLGFAPVMLLAQTLYDWISPVFYGDTVKGKRMLISTLFVGTILGVTAVSIVIYFQDALLAALLPAEYRAGNAIFPLLVLAGMVTAAANLLALRVLAANRPGRLALARAVAAALALILLLLWLPSSGLTAAGWVALISAAFYLGGVMLAGRTGGMGHERRV